jgi:hypothetical protein
MWCSSLQHWFLPFKGVHTESMCKTLLCHNMVIVGQHFLPHYLSAGAPEGLLEEPLSLLVFDEQLLVFDELPFFEMHKQPSSAVLPNFACIPKS